MKNPSPIITLQFYIELHYIRYLRYGVLLFEQNYNS